MWRSVDTQVAGLRGRIHIPFEAPALGGFGPGLAGATDEGKLRGEVEGSLTFGLGAGYSLQAESAVRFGNEYFAAGGKLGLRKAF